MTIVTYAPGTVIESFRGLVGNIGVLDNRGVQWVRVGNAVGNAYAKVESLSTPGWALRNCTTSAGGESISRNTSATRRRSCSGR